MIAWSVSDVSVIYSASHAAVQIAKWTSKGQCALTGATPDILCRWVPLRYENISRWYPTCLILFDYILFVLSIWMFLCSCLFVCWFLVRCGWFPGPRRRYWEAARSMGGGRLSLDESAAAAGSAAIRRAERLHLHRRHFSHRVRRLQRPPICPRWCW